MLTWTPSINTWWSTVLKEPVSPDSARTEHSSPVSNGHLRQEKSCFRVFIRLQWCTRRNTHTRCTRNATLMAVIINRHCLSDTWNLLTHLQFWKKGTLQASYTWRDGGSWDGGGGGGIASTHLADRFGCAPKASNISRLKEFAGEVFNMVGCICCCSLCVLLVNLWGAAADQTHQCHHGLSWGIITSWNNTNSRVQRPGMKRWHTYQEFRMCFCVWTFVRATLR